MNFGNGLGQLNKVMANKLFDTNCLYGSQVYKFPPTKKFHSYNILTNWSVISTILVMVEM